MSKDKPLPRIKVKIGPSGWLHSDWTGIIYPSSPQQRFHELTYLSEFFDTIEINTTLHRPLKPQIAKLWVHQVAQNPYFQFTAILWQKFTHQYNKNKEDRRIFKEGLEPLRQSGRLGALLLQFPPSFHNTNQNREYLEGLLIEFSEYPLVVEVRNKTWNQKTICQILQQRKVGIYNTNDSQISLGLQSAEVKIKVNGYIRLCESQNLIHSLPSQENNNGDYHTISKLRSWEREIRYIANRTKTTYVITENDSRGKSIVKSLQLTSLLRNRKVKIPKNLLKYYPDLRKITQIEPCQIFQQTNLPFESLHSASLLKPHALQVFN